MKMNKRGFILVNVLVFGVIVIIVTTALVNWGATMLRNTKQLNAREQAFQIAEAGIDYYRWHLAHAPIDYVDGNVGTTTTGPFIHDFKDKDGNVIGQFALTITPPSAGSTLVKIKSKGTVTEDANVSRTIQTSLAIPSFAKFAVVANDFMRFGDGTEVFGPIHSNNGIRFDGLAHNIITSAKDKFIDPDQGTHNPAWYQFGVYTTQTPSELNTDSTPPSTVPSRPDVFMTGRQFPVAVVDFTGITTDLSKMKADAIANGKYFAASGAQGYHIVLKTNDTFDIYKVNSLKPSPSRNCWNWLGQNGWGTWSINTTGNAQTFLQNSPLPANGIIFVEDYVWVDGQINSARVTIAAGKFPDSPSTRKDITVNADLLYTNYDGQDVISLIAQGNMNTGLYSDDSLRIDAAIIAQNGRIGRYYYSNYCGSTYKRSDITLYGMIASNIRYGFAYTDNTGYNIRNIVYDGNLLYAPPPSFPLTSDQYTTISWEEVK
ncbi:MAG: type II secretion system protein [Patescibacteria group bacterium]